MKITKLTKSSTLPPVSWTKVLTHYTLERINWSYLLLIAPINPFSSSFSLLSYKEGRKNI